MLRIAEPAFQCVSLTPKAGLVTAVLRTRHGQVFEQRRIIKRLMVGLELRKITLVAA